MDSSQKEILAEKGGRVAVVLSALLTEHSVAEMAGIDKEKTESLYEVARRLYVSEEYEDSLKLFSLLCLFDSQDERFFSGLAACYKESGQYEKAIDAYSAVAYLTALKDPQPFYFSALCLLKLNRREDAVDMLSAVEITGREGHPEDEVYISKAAALLKFLSAAEE